MTGGKIIILIGIILILVGIILNYAPWLVNWFGQLPGDVNIKDTHKRIFVPIMSMIVISILLTVIVNLFFRK
jgi:Zn-dependent protease with chaperone function